MIIDEKLGLKLLSKIESIQNISEDLIISEFLDLTKEFICIICSFIVTDPTTCKICENMFCKKCINEWLKNNTKCPIRCIKFEHKEITKQTKNVMNKIKLKCINHLQGCNELLIFENYQKHLYGCEFIKFQCKHCEYVGSYNLCAEHTKSCKASFIYCEFCEKTFKKDNFISQHTSEMCYEDTSKYKIIQKFYFRENYEKSRRRNFNDK